MGFIHIDGLEEALMLNIIEERNNKGHYLHLQDFIERTNIGIEQLNILIRIGALRITGKNKKELLWEGNFLQKKSSRHTINSLLFKDKPIEFKLPDLHQHPLDDAIDEIQLPGFPLCNVFELVNDDVAVYMPAKEIENI